MHHGISEHKETASASWFTYAHKSAESFTVLFSSQDGVLGWDTKFNDDGDISGMVGGAYTKKNTFAATAAKPF